MKLEELTHTVFEPLIETDFTCVNADGGQVRLRLTEVQVMTHSYQSPRPLARIKSFALLFLGPFEPVLPQKTYTFSHDSVGEIEDLFIVPVGRNSEGTKYEAVFN